MADAEFDVCVVGGGPAGASLALRLAQLGRRVAIAEKAVFPRRHIGESLTAGVMPLLETLGLRAAVESEGFVASSWATVDWAGERNRYQPREGPSLLVDRARFDALLLNRASAAPGVRLYQPARVVRATRSGERWAVGLHTGETIHARLLAEASGRARVLGRSRRSIGAPTLAVYAYWRGARDGADGDTLVEGGPDAWYWAAPVPGGELNATVFVDPGPAADYELLIRRSKLLGPRLRDARRSSEIRICDATPFVDRTPVTPASIKTGEAALAIDPLSSQGVQTAIGTALHAAIVLNTLLDRPQDAELAVDFYAARIRRSAEFHAAAAAEFYRRQAAADGGEFWRKRMTVAEPKPTRDPPAPDSIVELAPELEFAPVAVAGEAYVMRKDGVRASGKTYAFVGKGLPVAPLLREIEGRMTAMEVVRRWSREMPAAGALQVLNWAWSEGLVRPLNNDLAPEGAQVSGRGALGAKNGLALANQPSTSRART